MFRRIPFPGIRLSRSAFERHVLAFLPELHRSARALLGQPADAEDLVHDTCLKAFAAFGNARLHSEAASQAWLRQILVNGFRDRYRREQRSPIAPPWGNRVTADGGDAAIIDLAASPEPTPEQRAVQSDFAEAVESAFTALPPEVRTVAVLHIVNGLPYKDIAQLTEAPLGTVMSRLARGRRLLRAALKAHVSDAGNASSRSGGALRASEYR